MKQSLSVAPKSLMPYGESSSKYVLSYELTKEFDGEVVASTRDLIAETSVVDVFISIRTENDSEIVDIPKFVTKFVRDSGAELTFSFTVA